MTQTSTSTAGEVGEMIEQLRALHVWPQFVADEHADTLTPRQIKGLYEVGNVAEVAVALLEELSNALAEPKCKCERLAGSDTEAMRDKLSAAYERGYREACEDQGTIPFTDQLGDGVGQFLADIDAALAKGGAA